MANEEVDLKSKFFDTLVGLSVETKGIVANHDESLSTQGVQQIWNALKLADMQVVERKP